MAWKTAKYKLTGDAPLMMHNGQLANPLNSFAKRLKQVSSKRKKTDADYEEMAHIEFLGGLYINGKGPYLPAYNIQKTIINGARKVNEGKIAESSMYCGADAPLEYDGPKDAEGLWKEEDFRSCLLVKVKQARIVRTRPIFADWGCTVELMYDAEQINESQLDRWMDLAGTTVGICEQRPTLGRFSAEKV